MSKIPPFPNSVPSATVPANAGNAFNSLSVPTPEITVVEGTWLGKQLPSLTTIIKGVHAVNRHTQFGLALLLALLTGILGQNLFPSTSNETIAVFTFLTFIWEWFTISLIRLINEKWGGK